MIKPCTSEHFDDWVRLRIALWHDETLEEHRRYAASILERPDDATVYSHLKWMKMLRLLPRD
jgi:hypothetical protein